MKIITTQKDWYINASACRILFRKIVPLTEFDEVLLNLLSVHDGKISKNELGLLLGFGMENRPKENIYQDEAEIKIFEHFCQELKRYFLIRLVT